MPEDRRNDPIYPYYVVGVLMVAYMISFIDRTILSLLIDPVRRDLDLTDTQISLLIGFAFALFYTVLGLPAGRWADSRGRRNLILIGIVFWSVMTVACGLARNFWQLFFARMGVGVGEATLSPASYSMIADYFPPHRLGFAMSLYASGVTMGGGLALVLGGFVVDWAVSVGSLDLPIIGEIRAWQMAFLVVGCFGLPVAAAMLSVREPERRIPPGGSSLAPTLGEIGAYLRRNSATFGWIYGGYAVMIIMNYAVILWVPTFYIRLHGLSPGEVGLIYGLIFGIGGTSGLFFGGFLSDRLAAAGHRDAPARVMLCAAIFQLPFIVAAMLVPSTLWSFVFMAIGMAVLAMSGGLQATTVQTITPNRMRGQMGALYLLAANVVGLSVGPTVTALYGDLFFGGPQGIGAAIALTAATTLPVSAFCIYCGLRPMRETTGRLAVDAQIAGSTAGAAAPV